MSVKPTWLNWRLELEKECLLGVGWEDKKMGLGGEKWQEIGAEKGWNFVTAGAPGRGVLRFSTGGIQESRSFLGQKRAKNQKSVRLRGWCNITPVCLFWNRFPGVVAILNPHSVQYPFNQTLINTYLHFWTYYILNTAHLNSLYCIFSSFSVKLSHIKHLMADPRLILRHQSYHQYVYHSLCIVSCL